MAEYLVTLVVERVGELLIKEAKFTFKLRDQFEKLQAGLRQMQCFLKDADRAQDEGETLQNLVREIRKVALEAEDVLDIFTVLRRPSRRRGLSSGDRIKTILSEIGWFFNKGIAPYTVGSKIQVVNLKISELTPRLQITGIRPVTEIEGPSTRHVRQNQLRRTYSHVIEQDFVGLNDDVDLLVSKLVEDYGGRRAVSICGMGGLGKTTLAKRVYHHNAIRSHFSKFAWVCVSQNWEKMDVLKTILIKLRGNDTRAVRKMMDAELVKQLYEFQQSDKCLVVLDDIWTYDVWNAIRAAFPQGDDSTVSRILVTTRKIEVAFHIDRHAFPHTPGLLNTEESWQLLMKKAFPGTLEPKVDINMEKKGREMLRRCGGLPMAIVVLGGLLANTQTLNEWEGVSHRIGMVLNRGGGIVQESQTVQELLSISYDDLPYELKSCFLYLGNFQENYSVNAEKLCLLWIAEGIVAPEDKGEEETMLDVAERYLGELMRRSMIQVETVEIMDQDWRDWEIFKTNKTCGLHDLMRELCLSKRKKEGIQSHGNLHDSSSSSTGVIDTRKLAVYFGLPIDLPDLKEFKLLRVLDFEGFDFGENRIPKEIGKLIHLRFLSFRNCWIGDSSWPTSIGNLRFLQVLNLRAYGDLRLPNLIWKLERLRHLYVQPDLGQNRPTLNRLDGLRVPPNLGHKRGILNRLDGLSDLETLEIFDSEIFEVKDLSGLKKLQNLRAKFTIHNEKDVEPFIHYLNSSSHQLRQSSLDVRARTEEQFPVLGKVVACGGLQLLKLDANIGVLPEFQHGNLSINLTNISLIRSKFVEDPMKTLEKLPNLQNLGLCESAYVGKEMVCSAGGFPKLICLTIVNMPNLENWRVEEGALHTLSTLRISSCAEMKIIPEGLRFLTNLKNLKISDMPDTFKTKVQAEDSYKIQHVPYVNFSPTISVMTQLTP